MDLFVAQNNFRCKIANSKNEVMPTNEPGIGIENVRKRLALLYPGKHELMIADEGEFFVVSLMLELNTITVNAATRPFAAAAIA